MSKRLPDPLAPWAGPGADAMKYWISLWPVAPFFGVEWRFQGMFPTLPGLSGFPAADLFRAPAEAAEAATVAIERVSGAVGGSAAKVMERAVEAAARATVDAAEQVETALRDLDAGSVVLPFARQAEAAWPTDAMPEAGAAGTEAAETLETVTAAAESVAAETVETAESVAAETVETAETVIAETVTAAPEPATRAGGRPANLLDTAPGEVDDLKMIRGIGPGLESKLNALGIYRFDQIAAFSESDLVWVDENLTTFKGRCFRDDWVGQARDLMG